MVVVTKEINNETPDFYYLFGICALLDDGDLTGAELLHSELCLDSYSVNRYIRFLAKVGFVEINGIMFSLTNRGKLFVEKMVALYRFMLSMNDRVFLFNPIFLSFWF